MIDKLYFIATFISYLLGFAVGLLTFSKLENGGGYTTYIQPSLEEVFNHDAFTRFTSITKNNLNVNLYNAILGLLSFGILPILYTFYNGYVLGCTIANSSDILTTSELLHCTTPHLSEIIAIALSCYVGYLLSNKIILHKIVSYKRIVKISLVSKEI